jgi:hypothetical protein
VSCAQIECWRDPSLTMRTANTRCYLRNRIAGLAQPRPRGRMDDPVDTITAQHPLVGSVDDRISVDAPNVPCRTTACFPLRGTNASMG